MTLSTHLDIWSPPPALPRAFFLEAPLEVVRALLDAPYPFVENEIHIHLPKKIKKVSAPARPLTQPVTHPFSPTRAARRAARAAVGDGVVLPTPGLQTGIMVRGKTKIPGTIMSKNGNNGKTTSRGRWRLGPSTPICATEGAERGGAQVGM